MTTIYAHYFEQLVFKFSLEDEARRKTPAWLKTSPFPPLPPRRAIEESHRLLSKMLGPFESGMEPEFLACALKSFDYLPGDHWYYEVSWAVWPRDWVGDRSSISVPILMTGESPSFEIFKYENRHLAYKG